MAGSRVALVIGNSTYEQRPLKNPVNDAKALSKVLQDMDFEVFQATDASRFQLEDALAQFGEAAEQSEIALAYYAGHGIQVEGQNYLIPTDVILKKRRDLKKLLNLEDLVYEVKQASKLGLVILDACRDNPFTDQLAGSLGRSMVGRGLARVESTASNVLVAFATKDNQVAEDGAGLHSPYAEALIKTLPQTDVEVRHLFGQVRDQVMDITNNRQQPFTYGTLGADLIYLAGKKTSDGEKAYWENTQQCNNPACYEAYLTLFPKGYYVSVAKKWLSEVEIKVAKAKPMPETARVSAEPVKPSETKPVVQRIAGVYIDNQDGSVTDTRTGLQWMRCSIGQSWRNNFCDGRAQSFTLDMAKRYARKDRTNSEPGDRNWRLPSKKELLSLVYCSSGSPMLWNDTGKGCKENYRSPTVNILAFPNTDDSKPYWADYDFGKSNRRSLHTVNFYKGLLGKSYKHSERFVRLVRRQGTSNAESTNNATNER